ncbi:MAG: cysteine--tRNA ligase [Candidatus Aminicenantes bacterium]|nr:cysteine--tRNA ligase [Candidatus Aminicenantes bacterium]
MIRIFDTYSGKTVPFKPITPGEVKLYTCGPTVYDYQHIGNYRAYVFEDLLKRFLMFMGFKVLHVMNITDIDDKTIRRAHDLGVPLQEYTQKFIDSFFQDLKTLNIASADHYPKATDNIQEMARMVKGLCDKGYAYEKDGSYYFDISKFPEYGRLSKINMAELKKGARIDSDEYEKESVHDFALWKAPKENEPYWETDIGRGRPGWHIECSVMSSKYLGETFDIHCGGVDNIFPHHENEIAQSEAFTGKKFVHYWMHCQHLVRNGEKMSKSLGNTVTIRDLVDTSGASPMSLRLMLLSTHYRKLLNFTDDALEQAHSSLQRIKDFIYELQNRKFEEGTNPEISAILTDMKTTFTEGLCDDLNISVALTALFELIKKTHVLLSQGSVFLQDSINILAGVQKVNSVLAVLQEEADETLSPEIMKMIEARENARLEKNFPLADKIRDALLKKGVQLEDTKDGTRWKILR